MFSCRLLVCLYAGCLYAWQLFASFQVCLRTGDLPSSQVGASRQPAARPASQPAASPAAQPTAGPRTKCYHQPLLVPPFCEKWCPQDPRNSENCNITMCLLHSSLVASSDQHEAKWCPKPSQREPWASNVAQNGAKWTPKTSQRPPKDLQNTSNQQKRRIGRGLGTDLGPKAIRVSPRGPVFITF